MTRGNSVLLVLLSLSAAGCGLPSGEPGPGVAVLRPDQVLDFANLYRQNCAACHGEDGKNGAALSLANPLYLAVAGEVNLLRVASRGVPGHLMPPFARSAGGLLTDQQIEIIVQGMIREWGSAGKLAGRQMPSYAGTGSGDPSRGEKAFRVYCAGCHGAEGKGSGSGQSFTGSLVDPSYLALVSDQDLRTMIVAGQPEQGMPDFRSGPEGSMTDQEITDTVAWLSTHRSSTPRPALPAASLRE